MSLHAAGNGLEDIIVGVPSSVWRCGANQWVMVEVKTPNKSGGVKPSKFTKAQNEWYEKTAGYPRLVVTGPQDAVDQFRRMVG